MPQKVKFYGGVLHGQEQWLEDKCHRIEAMDNRFSRNSVRDLYLHPELPVMRVMDRSSYEIRRYHEERGNCRRQMQIGLLEGASLLYSEDCELCRDMDKRPWEVVTVPSFLYEFDRWYNVKMYQITGRKEFLREEFSLAPSRLGMVDEYGQHPNGNIAWLIP